MPSLKDLKNRIASVKSTRKITKAMQMVAAAKLRRAQEAAEAARPYADRMNAMLGNLALTAKDSPTAPKLLTGTGKDDTHLLVVCTAERGLCGGFNSSIVRLARAEIARLEGEGKTVKVLTVGRKGRDQLKRFYPDSFVGHVDLAGIKRIGYDQAAGIAVDVQNRFFEGEFDVCTLIYSKFQSVISQTPTPLRLIPPEVPEAEAEDGVIYDYEPDEEEILKV
ncbi:MAG: ATP synthase F1 subunit gamma, partial [Pseudomonadota bacterium]